MIRPARPQDAAAIAAIWNPVIRDTTVTFTTAEKSLQGLAEAIASQAFLVAETGGQVTGFATCSPFRSGPGYARTMEHSIHVCATARGSGVGRRLMDALETHARSKSVHSLIAGISGENTGAIAFHTALGFAHVGRLPQVGWKFDRWLDLVLMQKVL
ncbi:GNAT family N-acetyltransferase [Nioella nitratireducens]|uniref:GNAT family N-acetyltransferase n=1 Tax=Nioella nitratireducens TaxID=1287720 RepID=UPI0008FCE8CC|nr:GNAT family N-acetyltransferase [Nioella nitratireducens]